MKYLIIILMVASCKSIPDHKSAIQECKILMEKELGLNQDGGEEENKLANGYIIGCVDAKTKE